MVSKIVTTAGKYAAKKLGNKALEKAFEPYEKINKTAYGIRNTSELIRMLIRKDYTTLTSYEGLLNLSDKQIINVALYNNSIKKNGTKQRRKSIC